MNGSEEAQHLCAQGHVQRGQVLRLGVFGLLEPLLQPYGVEVLRGEPLGRRVQQQGDGGPRLAAGAAAAGPQGGRPLGVEGLQRLAHLAGGSRCLDLGREGGADCIPIPVAGRQPGREEKQSK